MGIWFILDHIKTTLELSDHILGKAKQLAQKRGVTLRQLTEESLWHTIEESKAATSKPSIQPVTFSGRGLNPEFQAGTWEMLRQEIYRGHGA
jgi:hypothetical protein